MNKKFRLLLLAAVPGAPIVGVCLWALSGVVAAKAQSIPIVTAHSAEMMATNQGLFALDLPDPKDPEYAQKIADLKKAPGWAAKIMEIYGAPTSEPEPVLFVSDNKLFRPQEDRALAFLLVGHNGVTEPLQRKTVVFLGELLALGSIVASAFFVVANLLVFVATPARGGRSAAAD